MFVFTYLYSVLGLVEMSPSMISQELFLNESWVALVISVLKSKFDFTSEVACNYSLQ